MQADTESAGWKAKLFLGLGQFAAGIAAFGTSSLILLYYTEVKGLVPGNAAAALTFASVAGIVAAPVIGWLSDRLATRRGRLRFVLTAAPLAALSFVALWNPPDDAGFAYLMLTAAALRISAALLEIPASALVPALARDTADRANFFAARAFFEALAGWIMPTLVYLYFLAPSTDYPIGETNPDGYPAIAVTAAVLLVVAVLAAVIGLRFFVSVPQARPALPQRRRWSLLALLAASFFALLVPALWAQLSNYVSTFAWHLIPSDMVFSSFGVVPALVLAWILAGPLSRGFAGRWWAVLRSALIFSAVVGGAALVLMICALTYQAWLQSSILVLFARPAVRGLGIVLLVAAGAFVLGAVLAAPFAVASRFFPAAGTKQMIWALMPVSAVFYCAPSLLAVAGAMPDLASHMGPTILGLLNFGAETYSAAAAILLLTLLAEATDERGAGRESAGLLFGWYGAVARLALLLGLLLATLIVKWADFGGTSVFRPQVVTSMLWMLSFVIVCLYAIAALSLYFHRPGERPSEPA